MSVFKNERISSKVVSIFSLMPSLPDSFLCCVASARDSVRELMHTQKRRSKKKVRQGRECMSNHAHTRNYAHTACAAKVFTSICAIQDKAQTEITALFILTHHIFSSIGMRVHSGRAFNLCDGTRQSTG